MSNSEAVLEDLMFCVDAGSLDDKPPPMLFEEASTNNFDSRG